MNLGISTELCMMKMAVKGIIPNHHLVTNFHINSDPLINLQSSSIIGRTAISVHNVRYIILSFLLERETIFVIVGT